MIIFSGIDSDRPGESLAAALREFEWRRGVYLTLHDCRGIFYHADGSPFFPGRYLHTHPCCLEGRFENPSWNRRCHEECQLRAEATADRLRRPFLHSCWKGVTELVVPVERNGSPVLIFYAGPFRGPEPPPAGFEAGHAALPEPDAERLADLARLLSLAGQGVLKVLETARERERRTPLSRKQLIRKFLDERAHGPVTLADLAGALAVSPSRAGHLVTAAFACPFQELLLAERMTRARNLLLSTDYPQKEVARSCGFSTVYYFSRMFRRFYGITPGRCRATNGK